jgi:hypothetical protein
MTKKQEPSMEDKTLTALIGIFGKLNEIDQKVNVLVGRISK